MWRDIGLIGRDDLLRKKIIPRLQSRTGFVITGQHGIGKTALLEWAYDHAEGRKAIVSANLPAKEMLRQICSQWGLEVMASDGKPAGKTAWQSPWMESAIMRESGHWVFVDDIQSMKPTMIRIFKAMRERAAIVASAVPPIQREELTRMLWGLMSIDIDRIKPNDMTRIAQRAVVKIGSSTPITEAVHSARGLPAQLLHTLRGEVTPEAAKSKGDEINIAPVFLFALAGIMLLRNLGRGLDSSSMVMFGSIGMALATVFRYFLFKGMR